ncbi:hypothetical protein [Streptomyces sp. NPDC090798]|uniref:hypothetical protein n=1 Tax=Streptomyces sp. NPDC090798 TaxID=3365968 RepID=UPI0037F86A40
MFVDNSGRRARLLRRFGMLVGAVCFGYAVVLGMAFMGWGTSLTPSSLLPFSGGQAGSAPGGNLRPQGGVAPTGRPTGTPPARLRTGTAPSSATSPASASSPASAASASASTGAN